MNRDRFGTAVGVALGLAAAALMSPAGAQSTQGVSRTEIVLGSIQDLSGPIAGFGKQARARHAAARGRDQRAGRRQRPQAQAAGRGLGLRPQEGGAGRAEARQPGQDLRHGWRTSARRRTWPRCRCSSRRTSSTSCRSPRRARCTSRSTGSSIPSPPPTTTRSARRCPSWSKDKGAKKVCTHLPGRRVRPGGRARRRGRPEDGRHGAGREDHATSAAPPTSRRRWRG